MAKTSRFLLANIGYGSRFVNHAAHSFKRCCLAFGKKRFFQFKGMIE
jgi:hypothetical protein